MKIATDLEQSKKLAEILPVDSADMIYSALDNSYPWVWEGKPLIHTGDIPAWSLSALMSILPHEVLFEGKSYKFKMCTDVYSSGEKYYDLGYQGVGYWLEYVDSTNLVDACVEMIIKLHENSLL